MGIVIDGRETRPRSTLRLRRRLSALAGLVTSAKRELSILIW